MIPDEYLEGVITGLMTATTTEQHYETLLSPIYRWMLGDFSSALARSRQELAALGIGHAKDGARGLDLGAGNGLQTIPLVGLGYSMTAVDSSTALLAELTAECPAAQVVTADLLDDAVPPGPFHLVVCMGDTLTHLKSEADVDRVLAGAYERLAQGGTLVLTFRDYTTSRQGTDRFILVRADADRILTCCLDYRDDKVEVTDIVHERREGKWELRTSAYEKLRLSREWVTERLTACGLTITRSESNAGRITIVGRRESR